MAIATKENACLTSTSESSIVHTKETTVQFASQPSYGACLRRSCYPEFLAAEQVYEALDRHSPRHRDQILKSCRSIAWFVRHDVTGEVQVASSSCKLRWCPVCARARRSYIAHEISEWLDVSDHPKFLTLTLKHTNAPLEHQIKHLYAFFRELRRRKEIRQAFTGGIWFFHIKKSKDDSLWHPHLHCIVTGLYFPRRRLSRLWYQVTYGSEVVDMRPVHDFDKASSEAARYAACPGSLAGLSFQDASEMVEAMHGRRICGTWGTGRAVSLRPKPIEDKYHWDNIGSWEVVTGSRKENRNAEAILFAWHTKQPLPEGISVIAYKELEHSLKSIDMDAYMLELESAQERSPP